MCGSRPVMSASQAILSVPPLFGCCALIAPGSASNSPITARNTQLRRPYAICSSLTMAPRMGGDFRDISAVHGAGMLRLASAWPLSPRSRRYTTHLHPSFPDRKNLKRDLRLRIQDIDDFGWLIADNAQRDDPIEEFMIAREVDLFRGQGR